MLKTTSSPYTNSISALIAFKPRQVLLSENHKQTIKMTTKKNQIKTITINPEQKASLLHSVLRFLEKEGFNKTLKRFISEAQIQKEDLKASSLDLEDLFCKYLDARSNAETSINTYKMQEFAIKEDGLSNSAASKEVIKKKKKKRSDKNDNNVAADHGESLDEKLKNTVKNSETILESEMGTVSKIKSKERMKKRESSYSPDRNEQGLSKKPSENLVCEELDDSSKKNKDKKKMKSKTVSESSVNNKSVSESSVNNVDLEKKGSLPGVAEEKSMDIGDLKKEKKSSKKRKRLASDENKLRPVDKELVEDSKRRKTEGIEDAKTQDKLAVDDSGKGSKQEDGQVGNEKNGSEKTPTNQPNEHANGNLEKNIDRLGGQKSTKKLLNGSAEPKTVNAFQRVKIDEVIFADEKLQDNSYWAKDGAEVGYGAKAQEVLGQVKGRDFRHEKTKKKRGSYRGGQIDLQSHSVKFNYSDED